jgi:hypothetical protein
MAFDFPGIGEKVAVGVFTAAALSGFAFFGNWASQGGLVHALGGVTAEEMKEQIKTLELQQIRDQIVALEKSQEKAEKKTDEDIKSRIKALKVDDIRDELTSLKQSQDKIELNLREARGPATATAKPTMIVKDVMLFPAPPDNLGLNLRDAIRKRCDGRSSCEFDPSATETLAKFPGLEKIGVSYLCSNKSAPNMDGGSKLSIIVLTCQ